MTPFRLEFIVSDLTVFWLLLILGLVSGVYHGINNKEIYHSGNENDPGLHEKIHTFWIHLISGLVGSICLFLLYIKYFVNSIFNIGTGDVGVLLIGILGIVGLLPMTLWFGVLSLNRLMDHFRKIVSS